MALAWSRSAAAFSHQGHHVALTQDAAGHAPSVEHVEGVDPLPRAKELDRQAGDRPHGERRPAARIAVGAGEDEARQRQPLVEGLGRAHGVLAGQAVGDQQGLRRLGDPRDLRGLAHHGFVEGGAAGGVQDQHVEPAELGGRQRAPRDIRRRLAGQDRQGLDAGFPRQDRQLFHGRGTAHVQRGQQHLAPLGLEQAQRQLGRHRRLAGALQPGHQHHRRRIQSEAQTLWLLAAQHLDQTVIDDLDYLIGRLDRADHRLAGGRHPGLVDEIPHHGPGRRRPRAGRRALRASPRRCPFPTARPGPKAGRTLRKDARRDPRTFAISYPQRKAPPCAITRTEGPLRPRLRPDRDRRRVVASEAQLELTPEERVYAPVDKRGQERANRAMEKRLLQLAILIGGLVPVSAGLEGAPARDPLPRRLAGARRRQPLPLHVRPPSRHRPDHVGLHPDHRTPNHHRADDNPARRGRRPRPAVGLDRRRRSWNDPLGVGHGARGDPR